MNMEANGTTQQRIEQILEFGLIHMEEQPKQVRNGYGALQLFCASDLAPGQEPLLRHKADRSVAWAMGLNSHEVMNALQYLGAGEAVSDPYLTIGYYLMMADAVSYVGSNKPFLGTNNECGMKLPIDVPLDNIEQLVVPQLRADAVTALERLGIKDNMEAKLHEWCDKGSYTFAGIPNGIANSWDKVPEAAQGHRIEMPNGKVLYGPYAELAYYIATSSTNKRFVPVNDAISYALANRPAMRQLGLVGASEEEVYKQNLFPTVEATIDPKPWQLLIEEGKRQRADRMLVAAGLAFNQDEVAVAAHRHEEHKPKARQIMQLFPEEAVEYIWQRKLTLTFTEAEKIETIYPGGYLPGLFRSGTDKTRTGRGARLERFDTLYISNGVRKNAEELGEDGLRQCRVQSALHEIFHDMFGQMPEQTKERLKGMAAALTNSVIAQDTSSLRTMNPEFTLGMMMDVNSSYYASYHSSERAEEVLCNLYGFAHTELKGDKRLEIPELPALLQEMRGAVEALVSAGRGGHSQAVAGSNGSLPIIQDVAQAQRSGGVGLPG